MTNELAILMSVIASKSLCRNELHIDEDNIDDEMCVRLTRDILYSDSGETFNLIELLRFIAYVKTNTKWCIRIIHVNFENDITIKELDYDGEKIILTIDRSRNRFASGTKIRVYEGKDIEKEEKDGQIEYSLVRDVGRSIMFFRFDRCLSLEI